MKYFRHRHAAAAVVLVAASLLAGCAAPAPEQPPPADSPYRPVASIREVMNSVIDPSVDVVWNSVATVMRRQRHDRSRPCHRRRLGRGAPPRADRQRSGQPPVDARSPGRAAGRPVLGAGRRVDARGDSRADRQESGRLELLRATAPGLVDSRRWPRSMRRIRRRCSTPGRRSTRPARTAIRCSGIRTPWHRLADAHRMRS